MDLARSIQEVTEEIVLTIAKHVKKTTGQKYLCLAGGVALNCVSNGKLLRSGIFDDIYIQPAAGDAGGSLGAALTYLYDFKKHKRTNKNVDSMEGSFLGPIYSDIFEHHACPFLFIKKEDVLKAGGKARLDVKSYQ